MGLIEETIGADFNGVVSISKKGKVIFKKAYGYADLPNKRSNMTDTRFGTASAGKAFVAVGIMKLIEDGKLALNSRIGNLLSIDIKQISPLITIHQLLSHTSGIPDYFDESVMEEYADLWRDFPNYRVRTSLTQKEPAQAGVSHQSMMLNFFGAIYSKVKSSDQRASCKC